MRSHFDFWAALGYIAGGGLGAAATAAATMYPAHATQIVGASVILVGLAGLVRTLRNPEPTQTNTLPTASGGTVVVKTVAKETPP